MALYVTLIFLQIGIMTFVVDDGEIRERDNTPVNNCTESEKLKTLPFESWSTILVHHKIFGWLLNPKKAGNIKGYLGDCYPYKKERDSVRIVFLGDSFTGAVQVKYSESFVRKVRDNLSKVIKSKKIETINLGIGGYGIDQSLLTLTEEAFKYSPDIVIFLSYLGNDISDTSQALDVMTDFPVNRNHPKKRYITIGSNEALNFVEKDLAYYYVNTFMNLLAIGSWQFVIDGKRFGLVKTNDRKDTKFPWSLKSIEESKLYELSELNYVGIDDQYFSFVIKQMNLKLIWDGFEEDQDGKLIKMSGTINGNSKERWSAESSALVSNSNDASLLRFFRLSIFNEMLDFISLKQLGSFTVTRIYNNYSLSMFLVKKGILSIEEAPLFAKLLPFQGDYPLNYKVYLKEYDENWENAWKLSFVLLKKMKEFSEKKKTPFLVVTIPAMESLYTEQWEAAKNFYPAMAQDARNMDTQIPIKKMEDFLLKEKFNYISLYSLMRENAQNGVLYYDPIHRHFNELGHSFVGKMISDRLKIWNFQEE